MKEVFNKFKVELVPGSIQRIQMDDATYFGPEYKDYVSNSKLGLLNPAQGGSPQKFLEGFNKSEGPIMSFALGSAVHQLNLEPEIYTLSNLNSPSGKLGEVYEKYLEYRRKGHQMEKSMVLACRDAEYYVKQIVETNFSGKDRPTNLKTAIKKVLPYALAKKPKKDENGKTILYLPSDLHKKCVACTKSLKENKPIQKILNDGESYCEDVLVADLKVSFPLNFNDDNSEIVETIVKIKIKIDNWTINHQTKRFALNDLKTTGKPLQYFMGFEKTEAGFMGKEQKTFVKGSFHKFHYTRQMAMYGWLLDQYIKQEFGEGYYGPARMLVVETIGGFNSISFSVSSGDIKAGYFEFLDLIKCAAYHQVKGYENILEFENNGVPDNFDL